MAYLEHYGTPRHSGRYPWGSGKNPQKSLNILTRAKELEEQGLSPVEVAKAFGMSTTDFRALKRNASNDVKKDLMRQCNKLKDKGYSLAAISRTTGLPWSTVKNYLDPVKQARVDKTTELANNLKLFLEEKPYLDIGEGVNRQLNVSEEQLKTAASMLEQQGYKVHTFKVDQPTNPEQKTTIKVLTKGDVEKKDVFANRAEIASPMGKHFEDRTSIASPVKPIPSIDSKRVEVRYVEDGGGKKDGVIEIRPGVEDLSLDGRRYAQVRIAVDGSHYLKGMAVYGNPETMPKGIDIVFNTSKHINTPALGDGDSTVLKKMKSDPVNPFGSSFRQWDYTGKDGQKHISPINIVNDDEDWDKWKKSLSSQFLSKQRPELAKRQLDIDYDKRNEDLNEIMMISNPTVKRKLLESFAETADKAAVHLKAAAFPRQASYAILPVDSLKNNEVYAPQYKEGEEVILVRYPHQGTFEIPRLKVVHKNKEGMDILGTSPPHAIGINAHVAQQMSGADYDGDTVLVIPTEGLNLKAGDTVDPTSPLYKLRDFDPKEMYRKDPMDIPTGSKGEGFNKGKEMGTVSNLITDMTIMGADQYEIARAVRHAMVVIDAEKHNLDWRASEKDNGIPELKLKYQGKVQGGAATIVSRAKSRYDTDEVEEIKSLNRIMSNPNEEQKAQELKLWEEGKKVYRVTGGTHEQKGKWISDPDEMTEEEYNKYLTTNDDRGIYRRSGKYVPNKSTFKKLEYLDPDELSSGYKIELVYAGYSKDVKGLADKARAELRKTGRLVQNPSAVLTYKNEVDSLDTKLNQAALNAPKERQATLIADSNIKAKIQADPSLKEKDNKDKLKKLRAKEMENARTIVGAHRYPIDITAKEWEAIESGAISDTKLLQILRYADIDKVRELAMPREEKGLTPSAMSRARTLLNSGVAPSVVAEELGVSYNTLKKEFNNFRGIGVE